jgi:hypothetical protein
MKLILSRVFAKKLINVVGNGCVFSRDAVLLNKKLHNSSQQVRLCCNDWCYNLEI